MYECAKHETLSTVSPMGTDLLPWSIVFGTLYRFLSVLTCICDASSPPIMYNSLLCSASTAFISILTGRRGERTLEFVFLYLHFDTEKGED